MFVPVIMAGGMGTRLWPVSREHYPKQFCTLVGDTTMLQQTMARLVGLDCAAPLTVCNEEHRFLAAEQLRQAGIEKASILLEPVGRNTAPAITLAALQATATGEDPLLLVMPADHLIQNLSAFREGVAKAETLAREGRLVTFGIVPTSPETGFGYIRPRRKDRRDRICRFWFRGKARSHHRASLSERWGLRLEQRHVHVPGQHISGGDARPCSGHS